MVFCSECGKENPNTSKYCSECGNNIINPNIKQKTDDFTALIWIGRLCIFIFLPASLIIGLYLISQPSKKIKDNGWTIVMGSVIVWSVYIFGFSMIRTI